MVESKRICGFAEKAESFIPAISLYLLEDPSQKNARVNGVLFVFLRALNPSLNT